MEKILYDRMDWPRIEAVVYSEEDNPHQILGPHVTEDGILIQGFYPHAEKASIYLPAADKEYPMELADEEGYFAVLIPRKTIPEYLVRLQDKEGDVTEFVDPYQFPPQITEQDTKKFNAGIHYEIYEKLGAHPAEVKGKAGVLFAVWAPNALRVSVVGNFNNWDGRTHQMRRLWDSGIFELFIPGIEVGELYKYEVKARGGLVYLKADPYANEAELRPDTASVVTDISKFTWNDERWMKQRKKGDTYKKPVNIYEVHLGSWRRPENEEQFYTYRELAPLLAEYVKDMGYTHIECMPIMEYPYDASWGYQVTGYYAPTSRYGTPEDFMYFIDYMHEQGIGVILDWVPAHFPRDTFGLSNFDGTCLYEHQDPRQGSHPHWGTLIYNYGRPEVANFLIANALFWIEKYHADGIRMDAVASMLYLDYGKSDGQWLPNMYGGNENLEAIEMFKHLNSVVKKRKDGAMIIAEESTSWPKVTDSVDNDGLGFDYKWNMGWMNDFIQYMQYDPIARSYHYGELTFSMIYAYSERFILSLSHDEVVHEKASLVKKMPGTFERQLANLRAAYGFMMVHPGKKLLFMGQEFAQLREWSEERGLDWELLEEEAHQQMQAYVKACNELYKAKPALYELDYDVKGFEWINNISTDENILVFARRTRRTDDTLVVVCNFSDVVYENRKIGVPYAGKYKEIFNSDDKKFGGSGEVNPRVKISKKDECDDRPNSITIKVAPLSVAVFQYTKEMKKVVDNKSAKKEKQAVVSDKKETVVSVKGKAKSKEKSLKEQLAEKVELAEVAEAVKKPGLEVPEVKKQDAKKAVTGKKVTDVPAAETKASTADVEVDESSVVKISEAEAVTVKKAAEKKPVDKKPAEPKPPIKPAESKPVESKSARTKPAAKKTAVKKSAAKKNDSKKPAVKKKSAETPVVKKAAAEEAPGELAEVKKAASVQPVLKASAVKKAGVTAKQEEAQKADDTASDKGAESVRAVKSPAKGRTRPNKK